MTLLQEMTLGELINVRHGYAFPGDQFSDDSKLPALVTPGNFALSGGFQERDKTFAGEVPTGFELMPGDLIITMTDLSKNADTLGQPAMIPSTGRRYLHNQRIGKGNVLRPDLLDPRFLYYRLRTFDPRAHILGTSSGSTVRHTSPRHILDFRMTIPTLEGNHSGGAAVAGVTGVTLHGVAA